MNVLEEYVVKMKNQTSRKGINLVYFLFWTSLYQLICVGSLFWLDILPWYGNVDNISEFGRKYVIYFFYNFICSLALCFPRSSKWLKKVTVGFQLSPKCWSQQRIP